VTLDECWQMVETAEETGRHCVMLENCCYGRTEMMVLNMVRQGLLGELIHGEAGYLHELREDRELLGPNQEVNWRLEHMIHRDGNLYLFTVDLPERTGKHVLYVIWQRIDPAGEVFFSASDIDFGDGSGYGNPESGVGYGRYANGGSGNDGGHDHGDMGGDDNGNTDDNGSDTGDDGEAEASAMFSFQVTDSWTGGFNGEITIHNHSDYLINGWSLAFDLNASIGSVWNGVLVSSSGNSYTVTNDSWNLAIAAHSSRTFGFTATGDASAAVATNFVLNDVASDGHDQGDGSDNGSGSTTSDGVEVAFVVGDNWGSGYVANVTITNGSDTAIDGWTVAFDLDVPVSGFWNATDGSKSGNTYTFSNASWNGSIAPGSSVSFGLQSSSSADVTAENITFNGSSIDSGSDDSSDNGSGDTGGNPDPEPEPTGGDLAISVDSAWGSGFTATATVPTDQALNGWTVSFDFPYGIGSIWDAEVVSVEGNRVTVKNKAYNAQVPAGGTIRFGFNAASGGPSTGDTLHPANVTVSD